jgi:hypothetical protein
MPWLDGNAFTYVLIDLRGYPHGQHQHCPEFGARICNHLIGHASTEFRIRST